MAMSKGEKGRIIAHVLAGVVIILKGVTKWEDHHAVLGSFFLLLGLLLVAASVWHHQLSRWIKNFDVLVFAIEALVLGLIAYLYYQEGKQGLPWVYGLTSVGYLILMVIFSRRGVVSKARVNHE
ncbi:hypothetical protein [Larkinella knui]|uniref:DUF2127 domain-containing protein n=1 Tax=Larkinella knui TaxID=2025310 RepID=A0A3P1CE36_9BACT|nr:hypothetical protein [Larkinella knui]RRB11572.1 hypothetical protein EHT87_24170 [Larkinella knui]